MTHITKSTEIRRREERKYPWRREKRIGRRKSIAAAVFCKGEEEGAANGGERLKDSSVERRRTAGERRTIGS